MKYKKLFSYSSVAFPFFIERRRGREKRGLGVLAFLIGIGQAVAEFPCDIQASFSLFWASLVSQTVKNMQCGRFGFNPWVGKIWRREWLPTPVFWPGEFHGQKSLTGCNPWGLLDGKESACNSGVPSLIPGSGRSPGEGNGYPLQYSCLQNSMDRGA